MDSLSWCLHRLLCPLTFVAALAAGAGTADAASYDPELEWRTLKTEHFNVTFHGGEEQLANEVGHTAEQIWAELTADMDWAPRRPTEVVLVDWTDIANGYAMTVPVNTVVIFVTNPQENSTLGLYEDWMDAILTHEYAHILHLDTVEGIPKVLRYGLGRLIAPNQLSPGWIVEGQATYQETRFTPGGRGRSAYVDMILRMSVLEDGFPALGQLDGYLSDPPGGNARYLFGQSLMQYIADHSSEDAWTRWNHTYGSWIPYWLPARQVFGKRFRRWYRDWKRHLEAEYGAARDAVMAQGLTVPTILSDGDDSCSGPRFSPTGDRLVWACSDRREGSDVYLADGDGGQIRVEMEGAGAKLFSWRPDGRAFAYSKTGADLYTAYEDVYLHILGSEGGTALTRSKRARDPAFSPDGGDLIVVRNDASDNNLYRMRIDQTLTPLTERTDHVQFSTPAFSPDGRFIALSVWEGGFRDVWIYTREGEPYRRITADAHIDRDPAWSDDGRYLFFSSDRTGIANIYAVDLETERLWQVTNVLGGAFQPTVRADFQKIAWQHYAHHGFEIALADLDPGGWWDRGLLPQPVEYSAPLRPVIAGRGSLPVRAPFEPPERTAPPPLDQHTHTHEHSSASLRLPSVAHTHPDGTTHSHAHEHTHVHDHDEDHLDDRRLAEDHPHEGAPDEDFDGELHLHEHPFDFDVGDYRPLPTLLPPRYVSPALYTTNFGLIGYLFTSGVDTLRHYGYSGFVSYRTDANFLGGGGSFTLNRWRPIATVGGLTSAVPYGDVYVYSDQQEGPNVLAIEDSDVRYWERRTQGYLSVSYPLTTKQALFGRYTATQRTNLTAIPEDPYYPFLPTRGFLSSVGGGWRFSTGKAYTYSISPEDARVVSVVGEWVSPWLGSYVYSDQDLDGDGFIDLVSFNQLLLTGEVREYISVPWFYNHVLALRGSLGAAFGDELNFGNYRLGGTWGESGLAVLPSEYRALRGFPFSTVSGNWHYLGSAEYRFPVWRLDWGAGTYPLFLRTLHAAVFTDVGDAFDDAASATGPLVGAGGELRLSTVVGWAAGLQFRAGYAFALRGPGYPVGDIRGAYLHLGTSF